MRCVSGLAWTYDISLCTESVQNSLRVLRKAIGGSWLPVLDGHTCCVACCLTSVAICNISRSLCCKYTFPRVSGRAGRGQAAGGHVRLGLQLLPWKRVRVEALRMSRVGRVRVNACRRNALRLFGSLHVLCPCMCGVKVLGWGLGSFGFVCICLFVCVLWEIEYWLTDTCGVRAVVVA